MRLIIFSAILIYTSLSFAGVRGFEGDGGEKLLIESTADPKICFVRVSGIPADWSGKTVKTRLAKDQFGGESYIIDYKKTHGIGKGPKEYFFVSVSDDEHNTLVKGSLVKYAIVHAPGLPREGVKFEWSESLTGSAQSAGLAAAYAKEPFVPDLDKKP